MTFPAAAYASRADAGAPGDKCHEIHLKRYRNSVNYYTHDATTMIMAVDTGCALAQQTRRRPYRQDEPRRRAGSGSRRACQGPLLLMVITRSYRRDLVS